MLELSKTSRTLRHITLCRSRRDSWNQRSERHASSCSLYGCRISEIWVPCTPEGIALLPLCYDKVASGRVMLMIYKLFLVLA